jgi:hypothetical protein
MNARFALFNIKRDIARDSATPRAVTNFRA